MQLEELITEITRLVIENKDEAPDVFIEYTGHTQGFTVQIYQEGWQREGMWDESYTVYLDREDSEEGLKRLLGIVQGLYGYVHAQPVNRRKLTIWEWFKS